MRYNSEIQRTRTESGSDDPEGFSDYCKDITQAIYQTDTHLVLPTTDRAVLATANIFHSDKITQNISTSSPSLPIVQLFQNKANTYRFFDDQKIFRTPKHRVMRVSDLEHIGNQSLLSETKAPYFAKPSCPQSGGSIGAERITTPEQLQELMSRHPQYEDYLISELLTEPEINHTLVVNPDGTIATQCTYEAIPNQEGRKQRINIKNGELDEMGHVFGEELKNHFGPLDFRGVYNFDFLRDGSGELVLSEINPGRFPACMGVYNQGRYNPLEPLLLAINGESKEYLESYDVGHKLLD